MRAMTSVEEIAGLLGRTPIFSGLSPRDLTQLAEVAVPRSYLDGEAIFREGDSGDTCYVVRSGRVRVTRRHSDGRTLTLAEMGTGQMFGELAMFDGETRSATVEAITQVSQAMSPRSVFTLRTCPAKISKPVTWVNVSTRMFCFWHPWA